MENKSILLQEDDKNDEALLSNDGAYTIFEYGKYCIRFAAPYSLEKYISVRKWDNGYLVVMAKYLHNDGEEEEYIDLVPVLKDLYIDPNDFLKPIKKVRIK